MSQHAKKLDYNNKSNEDVKNDQMTNTNLNNKNFEMKENNYYTSNESNNNSKVMPLLNSNQQIMNQMNQIP